MWFPNPKFCKHIKHSQVLIEGSNWLLKVIFGGCIFLSFSTKIETFWSLSQRNCKLVQFTRTTFAYNMKLDKNQNLIFKSFVTKNTDNLYYVKELSCLKLPSQKGLTKKVHKHGANFGNFQSIFIDYRQPGSLFF